MSSASLEPTVALNSGSTFPRVGLGTWRASPGEVEAAVYEAIKIGYRAIDCARLYGNEVEVGRGIARSLKEGLCKREELFITSKVWNNAHAPEHCRTSFETTLKDLQLEYLDLYLIHWPVNFKWQNNGEMFPRNEAGCIIHEEDPSVASVKTCWQTMESFVDEKKARSIGVSNFSPAEIDELLTYAKKPVAMNQIEVQPYFQQEEWLAYCKSKGITVAAYCPLGNLKNEGEEHVTPLNEPVVVEIAKKYNKSPGQIILRWGVQHTGCVLPKSTNPQRLKDNLSIFDFELNPDDMAKMKELGKRNKRFVNPKVRRDGTPLWQ